MYIFCMKKFWTWLLIYPWNFSSFVRNGLFKDLRWILILLKAFGIGTLDKILSFLSSSDEIKAEFLLHFISMPASVIKFSSVFFVLDRRYKKLHSNYIQHLNWIETIYQKHLANKEVVSLNQFTKLQLNDPHRKFLESRISQINKTNPKLINLLCLWHN